jgi:hypothetical protein
LYDGLVDAANKNRGIEAGGTELTFENAFSDIPPLATGLGADRSSHFLKESAAYLRIVGSACLQNGLDPDLSNGIWNMIADVHMQKRQRDIFNSRERKKLYNGDAYLLFATSKVMVTLLFMQMNSSPWHPSLGGKMTKLFVNKKETETESVVFGISCVFACLDCLSDLESAGVVEFVHMYKLILFVFQMLTTVIRSGEESSAIAHLQSTCFSRFIPVLTRSLDVHLTSQSSSRGSLHICLYLSVLRAVESFMSTKPPITPPSAAADDNAQSQDLSTSDDDCQDDMWGGIDDALLANLDLDAFEPTRKETKDQPQLLLWKLLLNALDHSKVRT